MNASKALALSTGLSLATLLITASASAITSPQLPSSRPTVYQQTVVSSSNTLSGTQLAREKEPKDDRGKDGKEGHSKTHKIVASGGNKPCQLYYGCIPAPTPTPTPKKGGGADNPKGHHFAPDATKSLVAREREPRDDRGKDGKDNDKNDDHGLHHTGHKFADTAA